MVSSAELPSNQAPVFWNATYSPNLRLGEWGLNPRGIRAAETGVAPGIAAGSDSKSHSGTCVPQ